MKKIVLAIFATFLLIGCGSGNKPSDVAVKFMKAMYNGDNKVVRDLIYITPEDLKGEGAKEVIEGKLGMIIGEAKADAAKKGGVKSIKSNGESIDGNKAKVVIEVKYGNDEIDTDDVSLIKDEKGKWKVELM